MSNRNRLITGVAIIAFLGILVVSVTGLLLLERKNNQPQINQRSPLASLAYCSSKGDRPCILSFGLDADENMLINILTPSPSFPDFYLKIRRKNGDSIYQCEKVKRFPTSVYCLGEKMPPGSLLQFMIISSEGDTVLAEGSLAIIGLALPMPGIAFSVPTGEATASPTQGSLLKTPTPTTGTPSPSYPNPSYPNPSPSPSYP